jgi:hypothetical protein
MSYSELDATRESLALISRVFRHWAELLNGPIERKMWVLMQVKMLGELVGPLVAKFLIALNRAFPALPISSSIATLHDFLLNVKSDDLSRREDGSICLSERVRNEWLIVKERLLQQWKIVLTQEAEKNDE